MIFQRFFQEMHRRRVAEIAECFCARAADHFAWIPLQHIPQSRKNTVRFQHSQLLNRLTSQRGSLVVEESAKNRNAVRDLQFAKCVDRPLAKLRRFSFNKALQNLQRPVRTVSLQCFKQIFNSCRIGLLIQRFADYVAEFRFINSRHRLCGIAAHVQVGVKDHLLQ